MNSRLRFAVLQRARRERPSRAAIGALFDSMDFCDATRSHESRPSFRLQARAAERRLLRTVVTALALLASLVCLLGVVR